MNTALLSLGTNQGNKVENLNNALQKINKIGQITHVSSVYQTPPWGFKSEDFYNIALSVNTTLLAKDLIDELLKIEQELGRVRNHQTTGYTARPLDIDIIFFNDEIIQTKKLEIPHPRMQDRRFVLIPLLEIAPNHYHPTLKTSLSQLLENCKDDSTIVKTNQTLIF
ncbi:2-amino-4-hydroxy-6-hydroxymethyldihydropteridine diphosphokinase [Ochrovirga pacifica]|uniref:2-amino-4-hydroxy-6- hydroxymethyldihydropteridine diphosphokinase n=1 Tax=Ochrovirga pacifica TaxID=1042376 RepID=UPI0002558E77|nr:2-amino-4-hydroxy-6-hydroxymethyldihydropteridine diphosphokinase [Ochrovirga pacifica]